MLFAALVTILCTIVEYVIVADLRWGSPFKRAMLLTDPRMIALQLRDTWDLVALAIFLAQPDLPADHPYRDVACGFASAYVAAKLTFGIYHLVSSSLLCLAFGVRPTSVALITAVQLIEPIVCTAMLAALSSTTAALTPDLAGGALPLAIRALRWSFTGIHCPLAVAGGLATSLIMLRTQRLVDMKGEKM